MTNTNNFVKALGLLCSMLFVIFLFPSCFPTEKTLNFSSEVDHSFYYSRTNSYDLPTMIKKSVDNKKTTILYFYADWCDPCTAFNNSFKNKVMQEIGKNAYFINIDVHTDKHKLKEQYEVQTIPSFVKVDDSGKVLAKIHSGEWEQNIVSDIAPVMDKLINKNAYDLNREQYIDGWF